MSTANLPATQRETLPAIGPVVLDPKIQELVVVYGDLSKLTPQQKLGYYAARCDAAGLDIRARPFEYIQLQGKLTFYATKQCTDLLTGLHGLTAEIKSHRADKEMGVYIAEARVTFPSGRFVDDLGVTPIKGLAPAELCNAMMKACTKAKRRATLNACGLGDVIDESELETVKPSHHAANHDNATGHGSGAYAAPEAVAQFKAWLTDFTEDINGKWLDKLTDRDGTIHPSAKDLLSTFQVSGHLLKWAVSEQIVNAPDDARAGQRDKFVAVAWERQRGGLIEEAETYARRKWREAWNAIKAGDAKTEQPAEDESQDVDADPEHDFDATPTSEDKWSK